jgi:hypothetical protein
VKYVNRNATFLVVASLLAAVAAHAHEGMHGPGSEYDADASEALSLAEYIVYLKQTKQDTSKAASRFAALDANKDSALSSAEFIRGLNADKVKKTY